MIAQTERAGFWAKVVAGTVSAALAFDVYLFTVEFAPRTVEDYGWSLFITLPLFMGMLCPLILGWRKPRPARDGLIAALYALILCLSGLVVALQEGAVCIVMASPLVLGIVLAGAGLGQALQSWRWSWLQRGGLFASLLVIAPASGFIERSIPSQPPLRSVSSSVVLNAPPERVWPCLFEFKNLPEPDFWLFRAGVAHPIGVRMEGGIRLCQLSTGDMRERIVQAVPNRLLVLDVLNTPPCMRETNPFGEVHAPHLNGHFEVEHIQFQLQPLPDGRTRIVGTSVYAHRFAPSWYWSMWTDSIVRHVQLRVFDEMARRFNHP